MKSLFAMCCFLLSCFGPLYGQTSKSRIVSAGYRDGTVLTVEREWGRSHSYGPGTNPSDAPLKSKIYTYEVSVRVEGGTYIVRYESPLDHLPATISANNQTQVRVTKHFLYFNVPGAEEVKMPIVGREPDQKDNCASAETHS